MRHHESKHRMRRNPRWSRSPAAPQPHPRWKDAGVYVDDNGQRGAGGQRHFRQRFFGRGNQDGVRSAAIKTVGAPIHPLAVGVISEVDHRLALWKDLCWPSYRRAVGPKSDLVSLTTKLILD